MKKYIIIILFLILILIMFNPSNIILSVNQSFDLCIHNLFPTLFPFLMISYLLSNYGFIELCDEIGHKFMPKLFKINSSGLYVLIMSILSGSPSNAKYINQLLQNNYINELDAINLLRCTHFVNPLFIIGTIGITYLGNIKLGIMILISHYLGNFIIGLSNCNFKKISKQKFTTKKEHFILIFTKAIKDTTETLLLILGIITSIFILNNLINTYLHISPLLNGLLEITGGIKNISNSSLSILYKCNLITFFISFGGLSIHMQVISILDNKKIKYKPYFFTRIIHSLIAITIFNLLYLLMYH